MNTCDTCGSLCRDDQKLCEACREAKHQPD